MGMNDKEKIEKHLSRGLTVAELIEQLQGCDPASKVCYKYPSHDYWGSVLASRIDSIDETDVVWSEYHRTLQVPDPEKERDEDEAKASIILLS